MEGGGFFFRFKEKTVHQALVQKLARVVSGLNAVRVLHDAGFIQEQGAIQRMLDEFEEDINFLSLAEITGKRTPSHDNYLMWFWQEEYADPRRPAETRIARAMVPRKQIRAYIASADSVTGDRASFAAVMETLSKTYSGYVHGASPHCMEMWGGDPQRFHVEGMQGTLPWFDHFTDIFNYVYRGLLCFALAARAFGNEQLFNELRAFGGHMDRQQDAWDAAAR
ncbi:hypothetical protein AX768_04740 [Burkholderia sp. PAMC 28687]|nr:hypothetical protein AX768_04740 [Burkholderia sp. PAMC 28687]